MRKILTVVIMLLLCAFCVIGILFLGKGQYNDDLQETEWNVQTLKDTFQKIVIIGKQDVVVDEKLEGIIAAQGELEIIDIELGDAAAVSISEAAKLQGNAVKRGDTLINKVKAPFTCKVDRVFEQDKIVYASIVNYENTTVEFMLPQEYLMAVKKNDTVSFSYNGDEHEGKVSYISQFVTDGAVMVKLDYDDPDLELLINSQVFVTVVVEKLEDVVVVPKNAVRIDSDGRTTVTVQQTDDETESVSVECGRILEDGIVIESGLYEGMKIVVDITAGEEIP